MIRKEDSFFWYLVKKRQLEVIIHLHHIIYDEEEEDEEEKKELKQELYSYWIEYAGENQFEKFNYEMKKKRWFFLWQIMKIIYWYEEQILILHFKYDKRYQKCYKK